MSEKQKPAFNIVAKDSQTKEKVYLLAGWPKKEEGFEGFDVGVSKDQEHGVPRVTILLEYPDGHERQITLDPANKASTHYVTLFDNRKL